MYYHLPNSYNGTSKIELSVIYRSVTLTLKMI
jgi:hypothetical protein